MTNTNTITAASVIKSCSEVDETDTPFTPDQRDRIKLAISRTLFFVGRPDVARPLPGESQKASLDRIDAELLDTVSNNKAFVDAVYSLEYGYSINPRPLSDLASLTRALGTCVLLYLRDIRTTNENESDIIDTHAFISRALSEQPDHPMSRVIIGHSKTLHDHLGAITASENN